MSDLLFWTLSHGARQTDHPTVTYIDQLCYDTECLPNDIVTLIRDQDGWHGIDY